MVPYGGTLVAETKDFNSGACASGKEDASLLHQTSCPEAFPASGSFIVAYFL